MDYQESIKVIQAGMAWANWDKRQKEAMLIALEALVKQISKEVETKTINRGIDVSGEYDIESNMLCPNCKAVVGDYEADELYFNYCPTCGQRLKALKE